MRPFPLPFAALLAALLLLPLALGLSACGDDTAPAAAYVIESRDQWIGGPAANAIEGDFVLENGFIRVGVLSERCEGEGLARVCSSPGPGLFGGSLADMDLRRTGSEYGSGQGNDQFAEIFHAVNLDVMETQTVEVLADGSDGGPAIVRAQGPVGAFISYIGLLDGILGLPDTWQVTDYILRPDDRYLTLRTTIVVTPDSSAELPRDPCGWSQGDDGLPCDEYLIAPAMETLGTVDGLNAGGIQFGDFFFAGGDLDLFLPGIGFHENKAVVDAFQAGTNSFVEPFGLPFLGATGDGVSYAISNGGMLAAPIFTSSLTAVFGALDTPGVDANGEPLGYSTGHTLTYERFVGIGNGDVASAYDAILTAMEDHGLQPELGRLQGQVAEAGTLQALSGVSVLVYQDSGQPWDDNGLPPSSDLFSQFATDGGTDRVPDGSFGGGLPAGDYILVVKDAARGPSVPQRVSVQGGTTTEVGLVAPRPGILEVTVVDERGRPLPCKISLRPLDEAMTASLPDLGDPYISGGYSKVVYTAAGRASIEVPAGRYDLLISRGVEYSIWDSATQGWPDGLVVHPGTAVRVDADLLREVDTSGFISADLHVHAVPSQDSGVPLDLRILTMVGEGVEFLSSTDHDVLTDYRPVIESLGLDPWIQATVGLETTTIELGHYLGFPLAIDYDQEAGGAIDWTAKVPSEVLAELVALGAHHPEETVAFIGHPRDGILGYFDQFGLDPFSGGYLDPTLESSLLMIANPMLSDPSNFTLDFDGLELLNGKRFEMLRTPTQDEIDCTRAFDDADRLRACADGPTGMYEILSRTQAEQTALEEDPDFTITREMEGTIDDWFTLLNLGYRHTALGNSDTHGVSSIEAGCPRNWVVSAVDDPELISERDVAAAIKEHRVVPSYGPLIRFAVDGQGVGSDVTATGGSATATVNIQAPRWMQVDRVEIYENGRMIREFVGSELDPDGVVKLDTEFALTPTGEDGLAQDAWYVVIALGEDDLAPVFTPVDIPKLELNEIVVGALGELDLGSLSGAVSAEAVAVPRTFPVYPYAMTNPIWVDADGMTGFQALGSVPSWFRPTPE